MSEVLMGNQSQHFAVQRMFHPTIHVRSLDEAAAFFSSVFGQPSRNLAEVFPARADHASDYSIFTNIADVLFDSLEPRRYVTNGEQRYPDIEYAHLKTTGWFVDGAANLYRTLGEYGIRVTNSREQILTAPEPPSGGSPFHTLPDDAGIRYHVFESFEFPLDTRGLDGFAPQIGVANDPLGIEFASHHTMLTGDVERALRLTVEVLGGEVIYEGRDAARGVSGPYVQLADAIFHFAQPEPGTQAARDFEENSDANDVYHAITWKVAGLDQVEQHLNATGVRFAAREQSTLITDAATSLGIPWGFTTDTIPGDRRASP
ncbi:MAG: VOC family protein [Gulosibacter sp.]|uniref:VOC family protein n=1 Tax=Gulosibacter sp. TaxID=2817531 RepID=UPI003F93008C